MSGQQAVKTLIGLLSVQSESPVFVKVIFLGN